MENLKSSFVNFKKSFLEEFSSVRLAIVLLIFLAATTLIGTILPQEPMVGQEKILEKYTLDQYTLFKSFGLTDVFHSWWYLALLATFGLNITVASFKRVFPKARLAFTWPSYTQKEKIKNLLVNSELTLNENVSMDSLNKFLKTKNYATKISGNQIICQKGGYHRLGASVVHTGIIILLISCTISILTGFNGMVQLSENEGFYLADLGQSSNQIKSIEQNNWLAPIKKTPIWIGKIPNYLIKVNKTWREDYTNGKPKQWYSDLSVFDKNKNEIYRKTIFVNDPIQYMSLDVYQSNWGRFLDISFNGKRSAFPLEKTNNEELVVLPLSQDLGLKLKVLEQNNIDILEVSSLFFDTKFEEKLIGKINKNESLKIGPINLTYHGSSTLTGLQFKSNPGDILLYPGVFLMMLGVLIAFGSKKNLWLIKDENSNKILIGGFADRMQNEFIKEFKILINDLEKLGAA